MRAEGRTMMAAGLLGALVWLGVAVPGFTRPDGLLGAVSLTLGSVDAYNEARAVYGGLMLALAGLQATLALKEGWRRFGVAIWTVLLAGLVSGRCVSALVDGPPEGFARVLMGAEVMGLLLGAALLWATRLR